ncbi:MAG TPA: 2-C-methyl-D-erythritol 2,4-cyclodiphosphate synthase [Abditibacteriaceae bacterium]|nr:2-C-methyl-D-erythritol 2,4-cyclodiphosphate synthase [Abditibacteriaceae bacterium]
MRSRVGIGYDSHRLVKGRPLILGGIEVPFERGLLGHSDGDAVLHAITDALLGAAGLPDIGQLFPDTAAEWKNADSWDLLRKVAVRVRAAGWDIGNVDAVLIAQYPKISPYVGRMKQRIAEALQVDAGCVNLKGKTAEGMGALGAGEGMAAHAVCLLHAAA